MPETAAAAELYSALEKTARMLDAPCSRERVWPILTTFGDVIDQAVIALRVATGARSGEFNCHFMMLPVDPYERAVANGLVPQTEHPIGALLSDIAKHCPVDSYGVDFAVKGGFKKTWAIFPGDGLQETATLAGIPSMPESLAGNLDFFARHGLAENVSLVGLDYGSKTVNLYFGALPDGLLEAQNIRAVVGELGLPEPSEQMLRLAKEAFGVYTTLRYDSPAIERFCFSVMTPDPSALPVALDPAIEQFLREVPYDAAGRKLFYAAISATEGEFYKVQTYYQWQDRTLNIMQLSSTGQESA